MKKHLISKRPIFTVRTITIPEGTIASKETWERIIGGEIDMKSVGIKEYWEESIAEEKQTYIPLMDDEVYSNEFFYPGKYIIEQIDICPNNLNDKRLVAIAKAHPKENPKFNVEGSIDKFQIEKRQMPLLEEEKLKREISHIFESGPNEIRIFEMVKNFIEKTY